MDDAGTFDFRGRYAELQANRERLDACPRHSFEAISLDQIGLGARIECTRCKGEMRLDALNYYVRGYEAHGGNGNDILPGWKDEPGNEDQPIKRRFFTSDD